MKRYFSLQSLSSSLKTWLSSSKDEIVKTVKIAIATSILSAAAVFAANAFGEAEAEVQVEMSPASQSVVDVWLSERTDYETLTSAEIEALKSLLQQIWEVLEQHQERLSIVEANDNDIYNRLVPVEETTSKLNSLFGGEKK